LTRREALAWPGPERQRDSDAYPGKLPGNAWRWVAQPAARLLRWHWCASVRSLAPRNLMHLGASFVLIVFLQFLFVTGGPRAPPPRLHRPVQAPAAGAARRSARKRDETCPLSTGRGTRRVQLVREGEGGGRAPSTGLCRGKGSSSPLCAWAQLGARDRSKTDRWSHFRRGPAPGKDREAVEVPRANAGRKGSLPSRVSCRC
jgi:hypothetical protein